MIFKRSLHEDGHWAETRAGDPKCDVVFLSTCTVLYLIIELLLLR